MRVALIDYRLVSSGRDFFYILRNEYRYASMRDSVFISYFSYD